MVLIHSDWDLCGKGQSGHSCAEENHRRTQEDEVCTLRTEALGGASSSASCSSSLDFQPPDMEQGTQTVEAPGCGVSCEDPTSIPSAHKRDACTKRQQTALASRP